MPKESPNWEAVKEEFITGEMSLNKLGKLHGLASSTMSGHAKSGGWIELREQFRIETSNRSLTRIQENLIEEKVRIYEKTRTAAVIMVDTILDAVSDKDGLFRHLVQKEEETYDSDTKIRTKTKWAESPVLEVINGKNLSDVAKGMKDLNYIVRLLDDIVEAGVRQKLEIEREKLALDKTKVGMSDDSDENETGIAYMPGMDMSLLEGALPDPNDEKNDEMNQPGVVI